MVRRLKSELPPLEDGTPRFPRREIDAIEVHYPAAERTAHRMLADYADSRRKTAGDGSDPVIAPIRAARCSLRQRSRLHPGREQFRVTSRPDLSIVTFSHSEPFIIKARLPTRRQGSKVLLLCGIAS